MICNENETVNLLHGSHQSPEWFLQIYARRIPSLPSETSRALVGGFFYFFSPSEILFSAWVRLSMLWETNLPLWFPLGCIQAAGGAAAGEEPLAAVGERHAAHHQQRPER